MTDRLNQITKYKNKVKRKKLDNSFLAMSKNLIETDFDLDLLKLFKIDNLDSMSDHVAAFTGCEPFRKEILNITTDIEKYTDFKKRAEQLTEDTLKNDPSLESCNEYIYNMEKKCLQWDDTYSSYIKRNANLPNLITQYRDVLYNNYNK